MEKIENFRIIGMTVEGFKCFAEKKAFEFGDMSIITGHNGQGKSSIAEAIAYAITGNPLYGEQSLDRLYSLGGKSVSVELIIETGGGKKHKLTRSRIKDVTTMTFDGVTIRQSDLCAMFGERDVFLSIFNPLYFIEVLGDKGRNLLERYLPAVPHEAVLERLSENARKLLEDQKMKSPESLLEKVRADIRNLEDTVIYVEGQRDLLESQAREKKESIIRKRGEIDELDVSIEALEKKRTEGLSFVDMQTKLDGLYARCDELTHEGITPPDTTEIDAKIQEALAALEKRRAEEYASIYTGQLAEMNAEVTGLRKRYSSENTILSGLKPGIQCPMCKLIITEQNVGSVKKAFEDSIAGVLAKGRGLTAQLDELKALDDKTGSVFNDFRDEDVQKLDSALEELRMQRIEIVSEADSIAAESKAQLDLLKGQIQSLELDIRFGNLDPAEGWTLDSLKEDRVKLESELTALNEAVDNSGAVEKADDIESIKKSITAKRDLEETVKCYISERVRLMLEGFGSLNRVDIVLFEAVKKTGVVKDVFKFSYEGKPYRFLSLSEKIKAGLEISELVKRLTGRNYPVFIDNGESVPVIDNVKPTGQVFVAQVVRGAPLEVSAGAQEARKVAA